MNMKQIELTRDKQVMVDDDDYEWLNQWKWFYDNKYAARTTWTAEGQKKIYMHRQIMGFPQQAIDHKDRNKLNCQRYNLRPTTARINALNKDKLSRNTSGYTGLIWCKDGRWKAEVYVNGKAIARYSKYKEVAIEKLIALRKHYYGDLA
jgi:hypothetical protein